MPHLTIVQPVILLCIHLFSITHNIGSCVSQASKLGQIWKLVAVQYLLNIAEPATGLCVLQQEDVTCIFMEGFEG